MYLGIYNSGGLPRTRLPCIFCGYNYIFLVVLDIPYVICSPLLPGTCWFVLSWYVCRANCSKACSISFNPFSYLLHQGFNSLQATVDSLVITRGSFRLNMSTQFIPIRKNFWPGLRTFITTWCIFKFSSFLWFSLAQ